MKNILSIILAFCLLFAFAACGEKKEEQPQTPTGTKVYVSIAIAGELKLTAEEIYVEDTDQDGTLTIDEVLIQAHEQKCSEGASAYVSEDLGYGLSVSTLWNLTNGGSYGIYVNNVMAMNLNEAVKENDHVYAYSYQDLTTWTDVYAHFDNLMETSENGQIALHLAADGYDEAWNPITINVEGAELMSGGKVFGSTDADGNATISIPGSGVYRIVAMHSDMAMVPAICIVTVK